MDSKEMRYHKRRKRRHQERVVLMLLLFLLPVLVWTYVYTLSLETSQSMTKILTSIFVRQTSTVKPLFKPNDYVTIKLSSTNSAIEELKYKVGVVETSKRRGSKTADDYVYSVRFSNQVLINDIPEQDLTQYKTLYRLGQRVGYYLHKDANIEGKITAIEVDKHSGHEVLYTVNYDTLGEVSFLRDVDLVYLHHLPLKSTYSAKQNNKLIQEAMELSRKYTYTSIIFPKGQFLIGSMTPEEDYLILSSNVQLLGNQTTLVVEGSARWFGLATGTEAVDGLTNFTMSNMIIEASDLENGNQFMIMANHGDNWHIIGNTFRMVHQLSSHVFDLGGVQNATFENNQFIGYAPELVGVTEIGHRNSHNFYSEAIQIDTSDSSKPWDANLIKNIDPNYLTHNTKRHVSHNIRIVNNQFLPYKNTNNATIARSATIGQHSTDVGYVEIYNNYFEDLLVDHISPPDEEKFLFQAVHVQSHLDTYVTNNLVVP